jgi:hypothetical protein
LFELVLSFVLRVARQEKAMANREQKSNKEKKKPKQDKNKAKGAPPPPYGSSPNRQPLPKPK